MDRRHSGLPSIIPDELAAIGDETNLAAMASLELPYTHSNQQVDAVATLNELKIAPNLKMKLFQTKPSEQPKSVSPMAEGAGSNADKALPSGPQDANIVDKGVNKVRIGTAMTISVSVFCAIRPLGADAGRILLIPQLSSSSCIWTNPGPLNYHRAVTPNAISVRGSGKCAACHRILRAISAPGWRYRERRQVILTYGPQPVLGVLHQRLG